MRCCAKAVQVGTRRHRWRARPRSHDDEKTGRVQSGRTGKTGQGGGANIGRSLEECSPHWWSRRIWEGERREQSAKL